MSSTNRGYTPFDINIAKQFFEIRIEVNVWRTK